MIVPVFVFDSRERWFPGDPFEMIRVTGARVPQSFALWAPDAPIRTDAKEAIDFPATMSPEDLAALPPVGYHRMQRGGGLFWHQWWFFYLYNPWSVAGVGKHEGDWEFVQTGCVDEAGDRPVLVTCSQHHSGGKREAWACERFGADQRPVVFVARGSHATYFAPGVQGSGVDECDGRGAMGADIEWRPFGAWASWPGRWGNSDNSPQSPGRQGHRWSAPELFHSSAR